jgi:uncharacterized DUF497 family protein
MKHFSKMRSWLQEANQSAGAIGVNAGGVIVVVFARLGRESISIISMRPASKNERDLYHESL